MDKETQIIKMDEELFALNLRVNALEQKIEFHKQVLIVLYICVFLLLILVFL